MRSQNEKRTNLRNEKYESVLFFTQSLKEELGLTSGCLLFWCWDPPYNWGDEDSL